MATARVIAHEGPFHPIVADTTAPRDELAFKIELFADIASQGCENVFELYADRFAHLIEMFLTVLPSDQHDRAICLARVHGYVTAKELAELIEDEADTLVCSHYLPRDACPCGCGALFISLGDYQ